MRGCGVHQGDNAGAVSDSSNSLFCVPCTQDPGEQEGSRVIYKVQVGHWNPNSRGRPDHLYVQKTSAEAEPLYT